MAGAYNPISYFYTDQSLIFDYNVSSGTAATDSFGPVIGNEASQFRTTSIVRSSGKAKVFAICKGQIFIQPTWNGQTTDPTKINIILKPSANYSPIKIKYFIYRGIDLSDWINGTNLATYNPTDPNQPDLLQRILAQYADLNTPGQQPGVISSSLIGYNPSQQDPSTLLDAYLFPVTGYNLPPCQQGDFIGNFTGQLGLDIVLDFGDYQVAKTTPVLNINLNFARQSSYVIDLGTVSSPITVDQKRLQEFIHQFLDPAAFFGSHIGCGAIKSSNLPDMTSRDDIYNNILMKYFTKNKVYVYVQERYGRSYGFFDTPSGRTLKCLSTNAETYTYKYGSNTTTWPILIKDLVSSGSAATNQIILQYDVSTTIDPIYKNIFFDVVAPNNNTTTYPVLQNLPTVNSVVPPQKGDTNPIALTLQTVTEPAAIQNYCSTFIFLYSNLTVGQYPTNYFDFLWPVNFQNSFNLPPASDNLAYWTTYDKSRMINLSPQFDYLGAIIQNKMIVDTGSNPGKQRNLFLAALKRNSNHDLEHNKLNIEIFNSGVSTSQLNDSQYNSNLFNDLDFASYLGQFIDNSDANNPITINSLSLIHGSDFNKKNSYFLLGITNDEYNALLAILPTNADNAYFSLIDVSDPALDQNLNTNVLLNYFKKYKVGLICEDHQTGVMITTPLFPATNIFIYTVDGQYFFSNDFSNSQSFYSQFANAKVEFRTQPPTSSTNILYNGEFGFDWNRVGDNFGYYTSGNVAEPPYQNTIITGYHQPNIADSQTEFDYPYSVTPPATLAGIVSEMAYKSMLKDYLPVPTQTINDNYFIQFLNLYSKDYNTTKTATYPSSLPSWVVLPTFSAKLKVLVTINENLNKLEFDYDSTLFSLSSQTLPDTQITPGKVQSQIGTITITCLKDFNEDKQIRVLAYPMGVTNKDDAQLAGIIMVSKNSAPDRKTIKFALVAASTKIKSQTNTGIFSDAEVHNLFYACFQSLLECTVEKLVNTLNLTGDTRFQIVTDNTKNPPTITYGIYIYKNSPPIVGLTDGGLFEDYSSVPGQSGVQFYLDIRSLFLNDPLHPSNSRYANYFTAFSFGDVSYSTGTEGQVQAIGVQNLALFTLASPNVRDDYTLNHEGFHGLGLRHTHRDSAPFNNITPIQKNIFPYYQNSPINVQDNSTDNVMSYNPIAKTLWKWQMSIVKNLLK